MRKIKINQHINFVISIKLISVFVYYFYSFLFVKHEYIAIVKSEVGVKSVFADPLLPKPISTLTDISLSCRTLFNIPFLYPEFSGCFNNYSWIYILDYFNLLNNSIVNIWVPLTLYLLIFWIIRSGYVNINNYINLILLTLIPGALGQFFKIGLNGIDNEYNNMFFNFLKIIYFNLLFNSPEVGAFGPEFRQIASFLVISIIYSISMKYKIYSTIMLCIILSYIHIYTSLLLSAFLLAGIIFGRKENKILVVFCIGNSIVSTYLQNYHVFDFWLYSLYHFILFLLVTLIRFTSSSKYVNQQNHDYSHRHLLKYVYISLFTQFVLVYFRHRFYYNIPETNLFRSLLLYEKGAGIVERIAMITRPLIYLYFLKLMPIFLNYLRFQKEEKFEK